MFFVSLVISIPTLLLTGYQYFKKAVSIEHSEGLFLMYAIVLLLFSLNESFQWVFQFTSYPAGDFGCKVVAVCREYTLLTLLCLTTCVGVHLCLLIRQTKCLMVIDEIKRKRHKKLLLIYALVTFLLPSMFLPWPFLDDGYGRNDYTCYIIPAGNKGIIEQLLMWHLWAYLVWFFTMVVIVQVMHTVWCKSVKKSNLTTNSVTLLCIMVVFLFAILINTAVYVVDAAITSEQTDYKYPWLLYTEAVCTSLQVIIATLVLMFRAYKRNHHRTAARKDRRHDACEKSPLIACKPIDV